MPEEAPEEGAKKAWLVIGRRGLGLDQIQHGRRCAAGLRLGSGILAQPPFLVHLSYDFCVWVFFGVA